MHPQIAQRTLVSALVSVFVLLPSPAAADRPLLPTGRDAELRLRLDTGAGFDDNVYWSLGEDPAHLPPGQAASVPPELSDAMITERPGLALLLQPGWRHLVELKWTSDLRHYFRQGFAQFHRPVVGYGYRLWRQLFLRTRASGEGFWRQKYGSERYYGAGARLGLMWLDPFLWRVSVEYLIAYRRYPDPDRESDGLPQQDLNNGVDLETSVRLHRMVELGAGYTFLWADSDKDFHDRQSHCWHGSVALRLPYRFEAAATVGGQAHLMDRYHEPGGGNPGLRRDLVAIAGASVRWHALSWLSVWASYRFAYTSVDYSDLGRSTHRQMVLAGVGVQWQKRWQGKNEGAARLRPAGWVPPMGVGTAPGRAARPGAGVQRTTPKGRWVTFRLRADRARTVSVVGSFNRWNPHGGKLQRRAGAWEGTFWLSSGRHTYTFRVDGRALLRPPGASTYVSDGFGGFNGVVVVR